MKKYEGSILFDTSIDNSKFESGIEKLKKTSIKGFAAVGAAAAAGIGAAIKVGSDFEEAMSSVGAISMATGKDLEMLKTAAKEMGEATKYSATQAANALEYLSLAGYTAEESVRALPQVLNLAAAGGMELAYASDLLTDSMAVMGLGIENMENFSDQLAMAASKSNTSVAQLGEAVLVAGGQAKLANMSVSEMNTALGILADKGIKGSEGGTALRNTLKNLYTPTSAAADMLEALGVKTSDASGKLLPLQDVLKKLHDSLGSLNDADKMASMSEIFDTRTIAAASALLDDCGNRWDELQGYLENCDGAAKQMADTMNDNLKGQLVLAASAAEGLGIQVYESVEGTLKESVKTAAAEISNLTKSLKGGELKPAIENVGKLFSGFADTVVKVSTKAIPPLIKVLGFVGENFEETALSAGVVVASFKAFSITKTVTELLRVNNAVLAAHSASVARAAVANTAYNGQLTIQQTVLGVLSGKIKLAAAAQGIWNAALSANPIGLTIAATVACASAIAALVWWANRETAEEKALSNAIKEKKQALDDTLKSYDDYKAQQAQSVSQNNAEVENTERLTKELFSLVDANGAVSDAKKSRVQFILGQLNKALGTEYTMTGNIIDQYDNLKKSVYDLIEAKKYKILMDEAEADYENAIKNKSAAEQTANQSYVDYVQAPSSKKEEFKKIYEDAYEYYQKLLTDIDKYENACKIAADEGIGNATQFLLDQKELYAEAANAPAEYVNKTEEMLSRAGNAYQISLIALRAALEEYNKTGTESSQSAINAAIQAVLSSKEKWVAAGGECGSAFVESLDGQKVNMSEMANSITDELKKAVKNGLVIDENFNLGISATSTLPKLFGDIFKTTGKDSSYAFIKACSEGLKSGVTTVKPPSKEIATSASKEVKLEWSSAKLEPIGKNFAKGLAKGIEDGKPAVSTAAANLSLLAEKAAKKKADIRSPSRVMRDKVGKYLSLGVAAGIEQNSDEVVKAFDGMLEKLEYKRKFDIISEDEYYTELERLRDKYLEAGSKEWLSYTEKIYSYQKSAVESQKNDIKKLYDDVSSYADKKLSEVEKKQESYAKKVSSFGELFKTGTIKTDDETITFFHGLGDINGQINEMTRYTQGLERLRQRLKSSGISDEAASSYFAEIASMSAEDAQKAFTLLERTGDDEFNAYIKAYEKKLQLAKSYSASVYEDEMHSAVDESTQYMKDELTKAGFEVPEGFFTSGSISAEKFGEGFAEQLDEELSAIRKRIDDFNAELKISASAADTKTVTNNINNSSHTSNYTISPANGESAHAQLEAARNFETLNNMRSGYYADSLKRRKR